MPSSNTISTIGLALDLVGVLGLFFFGLPKKLDRDGADTLLSSRTNHAEAARAALYDTLGRLSLVAIVLGFAVQICANYVPG